MVSGHKELDFSNGRSRCDETACDFGRLILRCLSVECSMLSTSFEISDGLNSFSKRTRDGGQHLNPLRCGVAKDL